jgi:hypothetical protein
LFASSPSQPPLSTFPVDTLRDLGERGLAEQGNRAHRLRVEHNRDTRLVHLSDEDGRGRTVVACDRASREWAVAQAPRQLDAAAEAYDRLYGS